MLFGRKTNKLTFFKHRIVKKGVYDLDLYYNTVKKWFLDRQYKFIEKYNATKFKAKGYEVVLRLQGEREITDYFMFKIETDVLMIEAEKVKVKDREMMKGDFEMRMNVTLIIDYNNIFGKSAFGRFMRYIYNNYLYKNKIDREYSGILYLEGTSLFNDIKEALDLYT